MGQIQQRATSKPSNYVNQSQQPSYSNVEEGCSTKRSEQVHYVSNAHQATATPIGNKL